MSYLEYEQQVKSLTGPLVPLLPPKPPTRPLPTLLLRSSTESPFGNNHPTWRCDTFVVPAAFPRSIKGSTRPPKPVVEGAPRRVDLDKALLEIFKPQSEALASEFNVENLEEYQDQQQLHLAVNRYRRTTPSRRRGSQQPGLTLVLSHANGFHKEIWEPAMSDLLDELDGPGVSWAEGGRDLLSFLLSYIDSPSLSNTPPSHSLLPALTPITDVDATLFQLDNRPQPTGPSSPSLRLWRNKLVVGIGHSMGGTSTVFAASALPSLFSSIILCDPGLPASDFVGSTVGPASGALTRRETWASRDEARTGFLKKAFFQDWDPRMLEKYIQHALVQTPNGVRLKARTQNEALTFADPALASSRRAYSRLHMLPPSLAVHFIFAEEGRSVIREPQFADLLAEVKHATHVRVKGAGHLVVHERPRETARKIANFLRRLYPANELKLKL